MANYIEAQGKSFLKEVVALMGEGKTEDVLRHAISAKLPLMFPEQPWWVRAHVTGTESLAKFHDLGTKKHGFIDVRIGGTVIEYERDLRVKGAFDHGLHQIKQYCAAQLNDGIPPDQLVGVLSDTVRWNAFAVERVKDLSAVSGATCFGPDHIEVRLIEDCDLSAAGDVEAKRLGDFLLRHLARDGGRLLAAGTLKMDLGFDSLFCVAHLESISALVDAAFQADPTYSGLITKLWTDFVSYLGGETASDKFDMQSYVCELYILTLAKLICANVLAGKSMVSDDSELQEILDGDFFKARGLPNLVEYDYFGWLNASPYVTRLVQVARDMQEDLRAYDFKSSPAEDLFGTLMAQLAERSQRLLLGQEWTPSWLAAKLVEHALSELPPGQQPRFLDMCCGSGAMVVETVKGAQALLLASGSKPGDPSALGELACAITAFDIDPLAVMLSKVGWVLVSKEWLVPGHEVQIPVYHADSLFANTPVTKAFGATGQSQRTLRLDTEELQLPEFLVDSRRQFFFDALLSRGYEMAMSSAASPKTTLSDHDIEVMVDAVAGESDCVLTVDERAAALQFTGELLKALEILQRAGRNGIWAFVLRNSFRPTLVAGRFNGVVTNPPWLALSKIGSNPYRDALKDRAGKYGIKAPGASHLHVEIATIFLLHAIDRYLTPDAVVACILPDTVLNGSHHKPFRASGYLTAGHPVSFDPTEIWKVATQTFKNEAIVLFGRKRQPNDKPTKFVGREVARSGEIKVDFHVVNSGGGTAWTRTPPSAAAVVVEAKDSLGPFFRQGADVMPRGLIFHSQQKVGTAWNLGTISAGSPLYYLRAKAKKHRDFKISAAGVSDKLMFDVLISQHLAPWELSDGAKGLLPFLWGSKGWEARSGPSIAALGASTAGAINKILNASGETIDQFFERVDTNYKKLTDQRWCSDSFVVFASAGGKLPCAAYVRGDKIPCSKTIIDQTLYWGAFSSEEEAIYIAALINSPAVIDVIVAHQPRGAFGERHIHKLAFNRTPMFDPKNPKHLAVVKASRDLLDQWALRRVEPDIPPLLQPEMDMINRRKKIRSALGKLSAWGAYVDATEAIYLP